MAGSAWDSFLTGASGLLSWATGGLTPIRGEPDGMTPGARLAVLQGAAGHTVRDAVEDPGNIPSRGLDSVWSGLSGDDDAGALKKPWGIPLWAWGAGAVALAVYLRRK